MTLTNDLGIKLKATRDRLVTPLPTTPLFHYTDTGGVLGIVGDSVQRATNALFLNDEGEIRHTADLVASLYEREIAAHPGALNPGVSRVSKDSDHIDWKIRDFLHSLSRLNEIGWFGVNKYVCCFCHSDDLLSQWRAYGDRGGGFSIGIDAAALLDSAQVVHPTAQPLLGPVIYNDVAQSAIIDEIYRTVKQSLIDCLEAAGLTHSKPEDAEPYAIAHAEAFAQEIFLHAPFFKQTTFEEEREWRLVLTEPSCDIHFRPHAIAPIPFVDVSLSSSVLVSLRIGPRRDHALARRSLELLLTARHPVEIYSSQVTLR